MPTSAAHPNKAVRQAFAWNAIQFGFGQGASAAVFFVLAAKLGPATFGVFALAALVVDFLALQGRSAATDALVQAQDWSAQALAAAFTLSLAVAIAATLCLSAGAGAIAAVFAAPGLTFVLPALALGLLAAPAVAVMEAITLRDLGFRTLALRNIVGVATGGAAGLAVAFSPEAEWALVAQRLTQVVVSAGFLWLRTRWRPALSFDRGALLGFGRRAGALWVVQALAIAPTRAMEAIFGLVIGPTAVGVLRVSAKFVEVLHGPVTGAVMAMWVPILSRLRREPAAARVFFLQLMGFAALIATPCFVGLGAVGPELAAVLLSTNYTEAGGVIFVLGMTGLYIPFTFFRGSVLAALGRNRASIALASLDLAVTAAVALAFAPYGLVPALVALAAAAAPAAAVSAVVVARAAGVTVRAYLAAIAPAYVAAGLMLLVVLAARGVLAEWPALARLFVLAALGASVYGLVVSAVFRDWAARHLAVLRAPRASAPLEAPAD